MKNFNRVATRYIRTWSHYVLQKPKNETQNNETVTIVLITSYPLDFFQQDAVCHKFHLGLLCDISFVPNLIWNDSTKKKNIKNKTLNIIQKCVYNFAIASTFLSTNHSKGSLLLYLHLILFNSKHQTLVFVRFFLSFHNETQKTASNVWHYRQNFTISNMIAMQKSLLYYMSMCLPIFSLSCRELIE